jgi:diguanylate cyclase
MDTTRTPPLAAAPAVPAHGTALQPAAVAKGALRRLAQAQLEPTPENYARAYAEEAGLPPPVAAPGAPAGQDAKVQGPAWAALVERLMRNLDRGGRQWTAARRKDSLQRVLDGSRSDAQRLLQRLQSLMTAWEGDLPPDAALAAELATPPEAAAPAGGMPPAGSVAGAWPPLVDALQHAVLAGLPAGEARATALADELKTLGAAVAADGALPEHVAAIDAICKQARRLFAHRHHLVDELSDLCRELGAGLSELSEDDSWAQGQCEALQARLGDDPGQALSVRSVRAASVLLAQTRAEQQRLRGDRHAARVALRQLIQDMLQEVGELGEHTGRFAQAAATHARAIEQADTLDGLTAVVRALLEDTRTVQSAVRVSQQRLQDDRARATELESRVLALEGELRRLSAEVSTDALTQVANRRGLDQAFTAECARAEREQAAGDTSAAALAVGLIDIDNFKKLNDSLGHAAGDQALKILAAAVRERLRPVDHLARFGGEEFVVLMPATQAAQAQEALTRLQRSLTEALFLHEGREVFVTFSGGVTQWRQGEALQSALERADEALYEAKRSGKNRTCLG